jgi:hypothetical protein
VCVAWEIHKFVQGSAESVWICSSSGCHSVCQNLQGARWLMLYFGAHELAMFYLCFAYGGFVSCLCLCHSGCVIVGVLGIFQGSCLIPLLLRLLG